MDKVPATILALLIVIALAGSIVYGKLGPEVENQQDKVITEMNL